MIHHLFLGDEDLFASNSVFLVSQSRNYDHNDETYLFKVYTNIVIGANLLAAFPAQR